MSRVRFLQPAPSLWAPRRGADIVSIGYICGADAHTGHAHGRGDPIDSTGSTDIYHLGDDPGAPPRLHVPRNYLRLAARYDPNKYDLLLNLVTDADLNPKVLANIAAMLKTYKGRVINRPEAVMRTTRADVAPRAHGIAGLIVPPTTAFAGSASAARRAAGTIAFPAILRIAGSHGGQTARLIERADMLDAAIAPRHRHVLTHFVDSRGSDALYRKLRVFFVGGRGVLRHQLASDHWSVHAADRTRVLARRPDLVAEERTAIAGGYDALPAAVRAALEEVSRRSKLDFLGVDFAIMPDGQALLFEANATMNFFPFSPDPQFAYLDSALCAGRAAFAAMIAP